jgi:hypothetical protein
MEVFHMDKCKMDEIIRAIEACNGDYSLYGQNLNAGLSGDKQWDKIICVLCTGCRKPLGKLENRKRLVYCSACREVLFPETVSPEENMSRMRRYSGWKGQGW